MQVYRHLSIGTAKPTRGDLRGVPYHLVDHVEPYEQYNLGRFLAEAEPLITDLHAKGKVPIICGGTGLYLRGLLHGVFDAAGNDPAIRDRLDARMDAEGLPNLYAELMRVDPAATHIMPNDRQRILRALEVFYATGKQISELQTQSSSPPRFHTLTVVFTLPRPQLHERINTRADVMLNSGLVEEVRAYLAAGLSEDNPAISALGYKELIQHARGKLSLEDAMEALKRKSRQYAKRQETWFRSMKDAHWIDVSQLDASAIADRIQLLHTEHTSKDVSP